MFKISKFKLFLISKKLIKLLNQENFVIKKLYIHDCIILIIILIIYVLY